MAVSQSLSLLPPCPSVPLWNLWFCRVIWGQRLRSKPSAEPELESITPVWKTERKERPTTDNSKVSHHWCKDARRASKNRACGATRRNGGSRIWNETGTAKKNLGPDAEGCVCVCVHVCFGLTYCGHSDWRLRYNNLFMLDHLDISLLKQWRV